MTTPTGTGVYARPAPAPSGGGVNPQLLDAIRQQPEYLRVPLLTTALIESGGRLDAVGDGGHSGGPFQENDQGRGHGIPMAQRFDPQGATARAAREFQTFWQRGARGASLAARAQRPADQAAYMRRYSQLVGQARTLLGQPGSGGQGQNGLPAPITAPTVQAAPALSAKTLGQLTAYLNRTQQEAMAGQTPDSPDALAALLAARPRQPPITVPDAGVTGGPPPTALAGPGGLRLPLATKLPADSFNTPDGPEGVPTRGGGHIHGALDWFAPAGSGVSSPVAGKVVEVKPSRGNTGQVFGGVVKVQAPDGRVYVFRHVDPAGVRVGMAVPAGARLGGVTAWKGGSPHAHVEVWKTLAGGYNAANLLDPYKVFGGR